MYEEAIQRGIPVLLPHYFDDCFRLGRKCREHLYSFPNPKLLSLNPNDLISPKLTAGLLRRSEHVLLLLGTRMYSRSGSGTSAVNADPQFLRQHVFFLGDDLPISRSDRQLAVEQLESCGAKVETELSNNVTCAVLSKRAGVAYFEVG